MSLSVTEISEILKSGKPLPHGTFSKEDGYKLVCEAIITNNLDHVKKLIAAGLDVNWAKKGYKFPLGYATQNDRHKIVEYLLAAEADFVSSCVQHVNYYLYDDYQSEYHRYKTSITLIANGLRTYVAPPKANSALQQFEKEVIRCRDVIVTLLGLKRRRQSNGYSLILPKLDRFLVQQELAVSIWSSRYQWNQSKK